MKKLLIIILMVSIAILIYYGVSNRDLRKVDVYSEIISGKYQNSNISEVVGVLGQPNTKNMVRENEIWSYGPSLEDLKNSKVGSLIGINVYVSQEGKVVRCTGVYRDM